MLSQFHIPQTNKKPKRFKSAGIVTNVRFVNTPSFAAKFIPKGVKGKGIRYQDWACDVLTKEVDVEWAGVWIAFFSGGEHRWAQPDFLGFDFTKGRIYVCEMKLSRVPSAWWQLNRLYLPILSKLFPKWDLIPVEVVSRMHLIALPEPVELITNLREARKGITSVLHLEFKP